ncbi:hypothetical protein [Brevundimonas sp. UBA7664]|uniref:hypothetical protein n=1 Tax=Brevundimonas sp. UBA7664 TaxID=1946141 RepID=UPI0025BA90D4|nr:hypothetical protein [Brevundimonas sp. UBA7664]
MTDADIRLNILIFAQRGLLFAVPPSLRAMTCGWSGTTVNVRFVFDGPISEDDKESARIVGTEVVAGFPSPWTLTEEIVRLDYPGDLRSDALPLWVYARKETTTEGLPIY